jgi:hypothetical protein
MSIFSQLIRSVRARVLYGSSEDLHRESAEILAEPDIKTRFERIYTQRIWSRSTDSPETASGKGSNRVATAEFVEDFTEFLKCRPNAILFDAPCGDFYFMRQVQLPPGLRYLGGDIAPSLVNDLRQKYPQRDFIQFDLTRDAFPACDIWLCRHCLFHLSFSDIRKTLLNFARSNCETALITNETMVGKNRDIVTGDYRPLDLTLPPINLPPPSETLRDYSARRHPAVTGIWTRQQIADAMH